MVNLLKTFDRERIEPVFMSVNLTGPYTKLLPKDIEVVDLGVTRVRYVIPKLLSGINRIKPDVILSTFERLNFALLLAKPFFRKKAKIVIREVNLPSRTMNSYSSIRKTAYKRMYTTLYPRADQIIAQSDTMRREIIDYTGVRAEKVTTIHNPIDVGTIAMLSASSSPFMAGTGKHIVSVGRLEHQKGFDILIHAFKLFHDQVPDSHLHILGEGSLNADLSGLAASLNIADHVHFRGFQENPYPYMKNADLFVLSSRFEGFPNVLLEALACKARIISADCDSGPRDILTKPEYGRLVPPHNAAELAEGMLQGIRDANMGSEGYKRAMDYDSSFITSLYEKVLIS